MKNIKRPLLIGNWKMNPVTLDEAKKRFVAIKKSAAKFNTIDVVVCPPFPFVSPLAALAGTNAKVSKAAVGVVSVGAQDISMYEEGSSKTGEVGARMIESTGASYVIVGHSERRQLGDTSTIVAGKVQQALKTGMNIIVCVGEKDRDNDGGYLEVIRAQIKEALSSVNRAQFHQIVIAYEPVWAIGRKDNVAITSYDLHQMVVYIRKAMREMWGDTISSLMPILYGGSVTAENAEDIMWNGEVNGLLVGRASWTSESFADLFAAISEPKKTTSTRELKETLKKAKHNRKKSKLERVKANVQAKRQAKPVKKSKPVKSAKVKKASRKTKKTAPRKITKAKKTTKKSAKKRR